MGLLEELAEATITALVGAGAKVGIDYGVARTTYLYELESNLRQGARALIGFIAALAVDVVLSKRWKAIERLAIAKVLYVVSLVSLVEQAFPVAAKPLYLNTKNNTLEGYKGTVHAAYMIYDGTVQQIDLSVQPTGKTDGVTTYVVITTEGVYVTTTPYRLQFPQTGTVARAQATAVAKQ